LFEDSQSSPAVVIQNSGEMKKVMEHCWNDTDQEKQKYMSQCLFINREFHVDWPEIKPLAPRFVPHRELTPSPLQLSIVIAIFREIIGVNYENCKKLKSAHFLVAFAKWRKATISFVMSVSPHVTTRLPLDGFS
jgi:hypothetical protein